MGEKGRGNVNCIGDRPSYCLRSLDHQLLCHRVCHPSLTLEILGKVRMRVGQAWVKILGLVQAVPAKIRWDWATCWVEKILKKGLCHLL